MTYATKNAEILALFTAAGKEVPTEDSNMGRAVQILQTICDSQSHSIPDPLDFAPDEDAEMYGADIFEALEELETHLTGYDAVCDDFYLDFDGNEYRIIAESAIWDIYRDAIEETVKDCYDLKLDKLPDFIAVSIDWEQTAQNAFADGYGHQFSGYDGSEEEAAGYYIFRTN